MYIVCAYDQYYPSGPWDIKFCSESTSKIEEWLDENEKELNKYDFVEVFKLKEGFTDPVNLPTRRRLIAD